MLLACRIWASNLTARPVEHSLTDAPSLRRRKIDNNDATDDEDAKDDEDAEDDENAEEG